MNEQNNAGPLSYGADLIKAERLRQVREEGWDEKNDDANNRREMMLAAHAYLAGIIAPCDNLTARRNYILQMYWPSTWNDSWYKPTTAIRDLVKAGALIAAEIDRLKRLEQKDA